MAIVGLPGWIGTSAVSETGQRWMSAARTGVLLSAAGNMSQLAGRSKEITLNIGATDAYANTTLLNAMYAYGANGGGLNFVVVVTGDIVSNSSAAPCLHFPASLNVGYIRLVINGGCHVFGRGGNGGNLTVPVSQNTVTGITCAAGSAGGVAITNSIGTKLQIQNNGAICGGGGGGGAASHSYDFGDYDYSDVYLAGVSGSGGRPFGAAGTINRSYIYQGYGGSKASPGAARQVNGKNSSMCRGTCGAGGDVGGAGGAGSTAGGGWRYTSGGGAAGAALNGSAPSWLALGSIYGSRL